MTDTDVHPPTDSLVRGWGGLEALSLRDAEGAAEGSGNLLTGHFAVYDRWTEINSQYEGHFMERVAPGAVDRTFSERAGRIKVLFNHGKDPSIGNKPLGVPSLLESDATGARYEVPLFDSGYVNELKPAIRAGAFGSSFRFGVPEGGEEFNHRAQPSDYNPKGLPERTLVAIDVYEFGPVTFGQYEDATAGMRSLTDDFVERMLNDPVFLARLVERAGLKNIEPLIERARAASGEHEEEQHEDAEAGAARAALLTASLRERRLALAKLRSI